MRCFVDAIKLSEYLISSGDFVAGKTSTGINNEIEEQIFDDFEDFILLNNSNFAKGGINDVDLITQTWLKKVTNNDSPECIPEFVEVLFE